MDQQVDRLVSQTWGSSSNFSWKCYLWLFAAKFQSVDSTHRYLIAVAGIPGSGKTTVAAQIASKLNALHHISFAATDGNNDTEPTTLPVAHVVPLDGFHLTRAQLNAMPNAEEAVFRRGAAFTFDSVGYLALVQRLREPLSPTTGTVTAPSFDHALKDPVFDDIKIPASARIVLVEGLYTALDREGWRDAAKLMDEVWFVDCPIEVAEGRVAKRNFAAGLTPTFEGSVERTAKTDMRNAREILAEMVKVDERIASIEEESLKSEDLKRIEAELETKPWGHNQNQLTSIILQNYDETDRIDGISALDAAQHDTHLPSKAVKQQLTRIISDYRKPNDLCSLHLHTVGFENTSRRGSYIKNSSGGAEWR
jgi:pantothenate kinase